MQVSLRGSSASTVTVGILLLTHARRLGERISVSIIGDPSDIADVLGPAIVHNAVLSGCGVGRVPNSNALVCVGGPAVAPLLVSLEPEGLTDWFPLDRSGAGLHSSSRSVMDLCRHPQPEGQNLGRMLRSALSALGCPTEPALLDLLFGAPVDPLERIALALAAGRAMTGTQGNPFNHFVHSGVADLPDPLPPPVGEREYAVALQSGHIAQLLARVQPGVRDSVEDWINGMGQLDNSDSLHGLVCAVAEIGSHLVSLPMAGMLPALRPSAASVAHHLGEAVGQMAGPHCAMRSLVDTFQFLGGSFVDHSPFAVEISGAEPPDGRIERWQWLCQSAALARDESTRLWERMVDPIQ